MNTCESEYLEEASEVSFESVECPSNLWLSFSVLKMPVINFLGFGFAVGNALKFTHEGCISVHVSVASDSLVASRTNAPRGKTLSWVVSLSFQCFTK